MATRPAPFPLSPDRVRLQLGAPIASRPCMNSTLVADSWANTLGSWGGRLLSPLTAGVSRLRRARMFHPDGVVYEARVDVVMAAPDLRSVAQSLAGPALVRFSSAWWRGKVWPDVLGMAVRFGDGEFDPAAPKAGDQDLLLATVRFPWTTPFAPLATRFSSFLWNHYHAVSPFELPGVGRVKLRLRSPRLASDGAARAEHLQRSVAQGRATFVLECRRLSVLPPSRTWEPFARLSLERPVVIDQAALRFSPFRAGRGIRPTGFVHHLRLAAYAASQGARPLSNAA